MLKEPETLAFSVDIARREMLRGLSPVPFRDELSKWLAAAPSLEALQEFAERAPHKWAEGVKILAPFAGYREKTEPARDVVASFDLASGTLRIAIVEREIEPATLHNTAYRNVKGNSALDQDLTKPVRFYGSSVVHTPEEKHKPLGLSEGSGARIRKTQGGGGVAKPPAAKRVGGPHRNSPSREGGQ